jgi:hypothetical protein
MTSKKNDNNQVHKWLKENDKFLHKHDEGEWMDVIYRWAQDHKSFDIGPVSNIYKCMLNGKEVTPFQIRVLRGIMRDNNIDIETYWVKVKQGK